MDQFDRVKSGLPTLRRTLGRIYGCKVRTRTFFGGPRTESYGIRPRSTRKADATYFKVAIYLTEWVPSKTITFRDGSTYVTQPHYRSTLRDYVDFL